MSLPAGQRYRDRIWPMIILVEHIRTAVYAYPECGLLKRRPRRRAIPRTLKAPAGRPALIGNVLIQHPVQHDGENRILRFGFIAEKRCDDRRNRGEPV